MSEHEETQREDCEARHPGQEGQTDEQPITSPTKSGIPKDAPIIHSFIMHPDGSVQDMKRYTPGQTAETVNEIRDSLKDLT